MSGAHVNYAVVGRYKEPPRRRRVILFPAKNRVVFRINGSSDAFHLLSVDAISIFVEVHPLTPCCEPTDLGNTACRPAMRATCRMKEILCRGGLSGSCGS
jgi:hypothetical protein